MKTHFCIIYIISIIYMYLFRLSSRFELEFRELLMANDSYYVDNSFK